MDWNNYSKNCPWRCKGTHKNSGESIIICHAMLYAPMWHEVLDFHDKPCGCNPQNCAPLFWSKNNEL